MKILSGKNHLKYKERFTINILWKGKLIRVLHVLKGTTNANKLCS